MQRRRVVLACIGHSWWTKTVIVEKCLSARSLRDEQFAKCISGHLFFRLHCHHSTFYTYTQQMITNKERESICTRVANITARILAAAT